MSSSEIILRASSIKLKAGLKESACISWNTLDASGTTLYLPDGKALSVANAGQYIVTPDKTVTYTIEAIFADGNKQTKNIIIEVLPKAVFSYAVKEVLNGENVSADLTWSFKYAKNITLDGLSITPAGFKSYLIDWPKSAVFEYEDAFGCHKEVIKIAKRKKSAWIAVDVIKLLLRPFTFIGFVGRKEYWWSLLCILLGLAIAIIPRAMRIEYDPGLYLYRTSYFMNGYMLVFGLLYLLGMLYAKRLKDIDRNPWGVLWLAPMILYPLLPVFYQVNQASEEFYWVSSIIFAIYASIVLIVMLSVGGEKTKHKNEYQKIVVW